MYILFLFGGVCFLIIISLIPTGAGALYLWYLWPLQGSNDFIRIIIAWPLLLFIQYKTFKHFLGTAIAKMLSSGP